MRTFRWLLVLALLSLLGACAQGDTVTAEQIMEGMRKTRETTRDAHAVTEVVISGTEQDGRVVAEMWLHKTDQTDAAGMPITQARAKVLKSSMEEAVGSEVVNDGTTVSIWNPARNTVINGKLADFKGGNVGAQDPTAQMLQMQEQLQQLLDGSDVEIIAENEPVAGLDAWKVKLTPKPELTQQMQLGSLIETTLWIEHARYLPLKASISASEFGKVDMTVTTIDLDMAVDPALFVFTPPAGAKIVDAAELAKQSRPATTSLDDAKAGASFALLAPASLPEGVVLDEVQTLSMGAETVIQNYSGAISFSLVQSNGNDGPAGGDAPLGAASQSVTVRGQEGKLITGNSGDQGTLLRWQENGVTIIIAGTLSAEQAQELAAGLE